MHIVCFDFSGHYPAQYYALSSEDFKLLEALNEKAQHSLEWLLGRDPEARKLVAEIKERSTRVTSIYTVIEYA